MTWRPAVVATVGVAFLPGFRDDDEVEPCETGKVRSWWRENAGEIRQWVVYVAIFAMAVFISLRWGSP